METDKKYVADVFDIDKEVKKHGNNNKFFLIAGVGSGKSTWVKDVLSKKGSVLFVTSRKIKVEEDTNSSCFSEVFNWDKTDNQTLITNAKLAKMITGISKSKTKEVDKFLEYFDYIVIDEVHSLATDSTFARSCFDVFSFMHYAAKNGKIVIAMTGTPEPVQYYFKHFRWKIIDLRKECNCVHPKKIAFNFKSNIKKIICDNLDYQKIIYFANNTNIMIDLCKQLLETEIIEAREIALIVSKGREEEFFDRLKKEIGTESVKEIKDTSEKVYHDIVIKKMIPEECKVLFSTSTLREGIDIYNENIIMFCENHVLSNLIQFFGRIRSENTLVYIINDSSDHVVRRNKILFRYALEDEIEAANSYLEKLLNDQREFLVSPQMLEFIQYVEKNPYIRFDYITNKFGLFFLKYAEETRLSKIKNLDWCDAIIEYCQKNHIPCRGITQDVYIEILKDALNKMADTDRIIESEKGKKLILNILKQVYGIDNKQPKKINEQLKEKGLSIRILSRKGTKKENRDVTYWMIIKENVEKN